ncbi:ATP phosphoribosyltransferase [candidate division KSB1 bacterium]|nr:ATP phosphoribosyltransferase [candidate division KSB1 bacterium]NIR71019.1 ATP phosphoribosyltransferase [candidate division KSB1 bacterium]NIS26104.1 ATP phosphoribosyltransferase [candidate division KSB1 bacterium]NIT72898.1 ATP phosphoribosyltransferase [candidate division KSB1 bacterium]NIU26743.1 ATP phosphoribosyltransferase [candidate division KSB1 bacterium]
MVLKIGLPKGSLQEATLNLLSKAGFNFSIRERSYFPASDDEEMEAILIRAQEIAAYIYDGVLDAGITGKDWIMENGAEVVEVAELVYSKVSFRPVRWVVAVPENSDIKSVQDLNGKRIATEAVNLTKDYLKKHNVQAEVEFSWGATEAKTPELVDAIVEITESGSSLRANKLRIVDTVMTSTVRLIANQQSYKEPWKKEKIDSIAMLMQGAIHASGKVGLKLNLKQRDIEKIREILPAMKRPTISPLLGNEWVALETIVDEKIVREIMPLLKKAGAEDIIEYPLNKVIY